MNQAVTSSADGPKESKPIKKTSSSDDLQKLDKDDNTVAPPAVTARFQLQTQRLFGQYMNSVVTYQDATVAWILTDDFLSRMSSTVYQRFAGGGHLGGVKVVRGYVEANKGKDSKQEKDSSPDRLGPEATVGRSEPRPESPELENDIQSDKDTEELDPDAEPRLLQLERQMSSFISSQGPQDPATEAEAVRKRDEDEIQEDYKDADGADQAREIEHLILVTHGIGQKLGLRIESINFIHDVNMLRKTLKNVYAKSPDLQALNSEVDKLPKNCRVQVLPVVWRHLLDFPKRSFKQSNKEQDLTDVDTFGEDDQYPSLDDITVDGVPAIRNLITDLALDILLFQSAYREHIANIVQRECNRIHELFLQRNPNFKGKISLIGHSLGSAILFDILCRQKEPNAALNGTVRNKRHSRRNDSFAGQGQTSELALNFEVEDFYCLGSPVGLFQMLKGRRIAGRTSPDAIPTRSPMNMDAVDDPFLGPSTTIPNQDPDPNILSITVSSPKCQQLFNIFHPADPICYRMEPLISPAMSSLKPQPLPYTKRGIFGNTGQGITGIGTRVGQSVSGFWSSITTGVASSLLNRSLGLNDPQSLSAPQTQRVPDSPSPNTINSNNQPTTANPAEAAEDANQHPPTLLDSEIETLYAGFQKRRRSQQSDEGRDLGESPEWVEADERARRLRREEAKVRALNTNGRVDFSIQE